MNSDTAGRWIHFRTEGHSKRRKYLNIPELATRLPIMEDLKIPLNYLKIIRRTIWNTQIRARWKTSLNLGNEATALGTSNTVHVLHLQMECSSFMGDCTSLLWSLHRGDPLGAFFPSKTHVNIPHHRCTHGNVHWSNLTLNKFPKTYWQRKWKNIQVGQFNRSHFNESFQQSKGRGDFESTDGLLS